MDKALSFERELYSAISMLDFWSEGKAAATEGGVLFQAENISGIEEFIIVGMAALDIRDDVQHPVEFLTLSFVLAKNVAAEFVPAIIGKLYEVNLSFKEGMFFIDENYNLCYEANFPVLRDNLEETLQLFIMEYSDTITYFDGVYPYLLRLIARPDGVDFNQYIMAMTAEE